MEHRWGTRVAVDVPIRLSLPLFAAKRGRLTNLSLSGAFIMTKADVRVLSCLTVVLEGPRRARKDVVTIAAYVARKAENGVGVEWCEFAPAAVVKLIRTATARQAQGSGQPGGSLSAAPLCAPMGRLKHGS